MALRARQKVRAPRRALGSRSDNFEAVWGVLGSALREIHTKNASSLSFEELYRSSYKIVLMGKGDELYERVKQLEQEWLSTLVSQNITSSISPVLLLNIDPSDTTDQANERRAAGEKFLAAMRGAWEDHQLCMGMITDVLMYMDKAMNNDQRPSIYTISMCLFRDHVLRSAIPESDLSIYKILESTVLFMIQLERTGEMIDRPLIRHCIYMLEGLYETLAEEESAKLYLSVFEPAFLQISTTFYQNEGRRLLETADAATFCRVSSERISEEEERCHATLSPYSEQKVKGVIDEHLISKNITDVINLEGSGVRYMLDHDRVQDLANVYELNARIDAKKSALTKSIQIRIVQLGNEINAAAKASATAPAPSKSTYADGEKKSGEKEKPAAPPVNQQTAAAIKWVDDILSLKKKFDAIWERAFSSDQGMQTSFTNSFSDFINSNNRSSEYLSLFFDENLKKGIKGKTDAEVDSLLENGITLLRYIRDKDLFETYYKKHLSRRLLMKRSVSMDVERQMISKMKMEVGNQFTQRLESMFKDMAVSEDLTNSYKTHMSRAAADSKRFELEVSVLTSTMWPMEIMSSSKDGDVQLPCIFPKDVDAVRQSFEKFYLDKHSGRKLSWQAAMGTADIRATFPRGDGKYARHDLNVSTYAMVILLLFNDLPVDESLTYEEIQARTRIPDHDLIRNLQSLAVAPKTRVLKKDPMSKDVKPTDRFFYNPSFKSQFTKVRIGVVSSGGNKVENQNERIETEKKMNEERGGSIEAAIVRIMKQRKKLAHSQLITEVLGQLASRFVPDVNMIKKRIESLIDREYLERIPDSEPPAYGYVA
ncbi:SCF ubiquitin ligase subunit CulC, putative [Talaromyces stipitatus ATCC 10500]|uniref:SCF ubiquitin ligase subunit CulC, putative n=1 Tax=Talaromyces stipitatus (strain ATCC 10500 / CBS 375.48 / QM 6759 / NRRL 1006) TaxID=441959 RepID=B8LZI7_TALSN|nr:SCF ubiquitin ligase subunit CulC, putative [Talaromyces stipitatus ATCC 10500]EED22069.1 SCF ubiquitin ligase subunit CulC, putative [Talaromyces stipitatus ATCC 10500]